MIKYLSYWKSSGFILHIFIVQISYSQSQFFLEGCPPTEAVFRRLYDKEREFRVKRSLKYCSIREIRSSIHGWTRWTVCETSLIHMRQIFFFFGGGGGWLKGYNFPTDKSQF